jgi:hypothetical protein
MGLIEDPEPGTYWTPLTQGSHRRILNPQGATNGDGRPSTAYNVVTSLPLVAWAKNSASGYDVVISRFEGGAWTVPAVVAGTSDDELDPQLVVDPADGTVHLFWWVASAVPHVLHAEAPADVSSWSAPEVVSQPSEVAVRPAATIRGTTLWVAYEVHATALGGTPRQIVVASGDGGTWSSEVVGTTLHDSDNRVGIHAGIDRLWIEWIDDDGEMAWSRSFGPAWEPIATEPFVSVEDREVFVRGRIRGMALD